MYVLLSVTKSKIETRIFCLPIKAFLSRLTEAVTQFSGLSFINLNKHHWSKTLSQKQQDMNLGSHKTSLKGCCKKQEIFFWKQDIRLILFSVQKESFKIDPVYHCSPVELKPCSFFHFLDFCFARLTVRAFCMLWSQNLATMLRHSLRLLLTMTSPKEPLKTVFSFQSDAIVIKHFTKSGILNGIFHH